MRVPGLLLLLASLAIPQQGPVPATIEGTVVDSRTAVTVAPGVEIPGQVVLDESAKSQLTDARMVFVGLQPAEGLPLCNPYNPFNPRLFPPFLIYASGFDLERDHCSHRF
jgi:hypothetical protein